jgi:hypothetical protein
MPPAVGAAFGLLVLALLGAEIAAERAASLHTVKGGR